MTYLPNIPLGTDNISVSAGQINTNFTQLNALMGSNATADHYAWNDATSANRALHKQTTFPIPRADPVGLTGTQSMFYPKSVGGVAQAFFANSAGTTQISGGATNITTNGGIDFPQGASIRWGAFTFSGTSTVVNFSPTMPTTTYSVVITPINTAAISTGFRVSTITQSSFTVNTAGGSVTNASFYYIAMGS